MGCRKDGVKSIRRSLVGATAITDTLLQYYLKCHDCQHRLNH